MTKPNFLLQIFEDNDSKTMYRNLVYEDNQLMDPIIPLSEVKPNRSYIFFKFKYHEESGMYGTVPYDEEFRIV